VKRAKAASKAPEPARTMVLYAWVGEGAEPGRFGIKQAQRLPGVLPMISTDGGRLEDDEIVELMQGIVGTSGKPVYLARFVFDGVVKELKP
jgi:hypothetical protein